MTRELAILLNTFALNAGGRLDAIQVLKTAEKQVESLENNGNHCWKLPTNKTTKREERKPNTGRRRSQEEYAHD